MLPSRFRVCPVKVLLTLYRCTDRLRPRLLALSVRIVRTSPLCVLLHGTRVTSLCLPLVRDEVGAPPLADVVPLATTPLPHTWHTRAVVHGALCGRGRGGRGNDISS